MATRTQAREMVVELLYAYTMGNERIFDFADELLGAKKIRNAQADFAKGLFNGVVAHLQNIDSIIEANLKSWELSRLGVIDKCILRLGVYEILKGEIDAPVAINEAIEIAKILGAENTGKFVNGVLDAIRKGEFDLTKGVEVAKDNKNAEFSHICHSEHSEESQKNNKNRDSSLCATHSAQNDNLSKTQNLRKKSKSGFASVGELRPQRTPRFDKGKSSNNKSISKPTNRTRNKNIKNQKSTQKRNTK